MNDVCFSFHAQWLDRVEIPHIRQNEVSDARYEEVARAVDEACTRRCWKGTSFRRHSCFGTLPLSSFPWLFASCNERQKKKIAQKGVLIDPGNLSDRSRLFQNEMGLCWDRGIGTAFPAALQELLTSISALTCLKDELLGQLCWDRQPTNTTWRHHLL